MRDKFGQVITSRKPDPTLLGNNYGSIQNAGKHAEAILKDVPEQLKPLSRMKMLQDEQFLDIPQNPHYNIQMPKTPGIQSIKEADFESVQASELFSRY